jgi:small conductance mechanosensitive channel
VHAGEPEHDVDGDDVERARAIILQTLQQAQDVEPDPKADVIVVDLAESTVNLSARWWTKSRMADGLNAQDPVLTSVKQALTAAGIDLPFPTRQILLHDQTGATDGDRRRQREGWPAGEGEVPEPCGVAAMLGRLRRDPTGAARNGTSEDGPARRAAPPRAG